MSIIDKIRAKAKADVKHVVLAEGTEPRTVQAAAKIVELGLAKITLVGAKAEIEAKAAELGVAAECWQSNHEGAIIDRLQEAYYEKDLIGVVINPGAYTHYSYAIHDALKSVFVPKVEIHISDIQSREEFRKISVTAPACDLQIYGHGLAGYLEAMEYIVGKQEDFSCI